MELAPIENKFLNGRPFNCRYCIQGYWGLKHNSDEARIQGVELVESLKGDFVRSKVLPLTRDENPILWAALGHGNETTFTGDTTEMIWDVTHNNNLRERIVYLHSCRTAKQLGPAIISNGGLAYGGFKISWTWVSNDVTADPYEERLAEGFFRSANEFVVALLQGNTIQEAYDRSYAEYTRWINIWETERKDEPASATVVSYLLMDRNGLVILGDKTATIKGGETEPMRDVIFRGTVLGQASAGLPMSVIITYPEGTINLSTQTYEDLTWEVGKRLPYGSYTGQAFSAEDSEYKAGVGPLKNFIVEEEPGPEKKDQVITMDVEILEAVPA